ncbi:MAG: tetratricopeptide repeat protein [Gemmataceae bacterium]
MKNAEELVARCLELCEQRRMQEADELAQDGLAAFPEDGRLWQVQGIARWLLRDFARSQTCLEQATLLTPLFPLARCALADLYFRSGRCDPALTIYAAIADDEQFPHSMLPMVASGLGRLGAHRLALKVCRRIARRNPEHHAALFGIAFYLCRLGYPVESYLGRLQQAHRLNPDMIAYRLNLAAAYFEQGHIELAHELVRNVEPAAVPCACWLRRVQRILDLAGDDERAAAFEAELAARARRGVADAGHGS